MLRAVAVLLVLGRHIEVCPASTSPLGFALTATWQRGGWAGVDLFFVLSGFLVSGLVFRGWMAHGRVDVTRFLVRRSFKIQPPFWLLIAVSVAVLVAQGGWAAVPAEGVLRELLFGQNYGRGLWNHTWSLAVEEHFYLALALFAWLQTRPFGRPADPFAVIPLLVGVVAVACLAERVLLGALNPYSTSTHLFPTHLRIDSLAIGVLLAWCAHFRAAAALEWISRCRVPLVLAGLAVFTVPFVVELEHSRWLPSAGLTLLALGGAALVAVAHSYAGSAAAPSLPVRALAAIGSRSYSIYLWHMPVARWGAMRLLPASWGAYAVAYVVGSVVVGVMLAALVEAPSIALRERLFPDRKAA